MASSPIPSKMDDSVFPLFPKFPPEIRLKIWEAYSMLHPRIVEVCLIQDVDRPSYDHRNTNSPFYTPTRLPPLFFISRESRAVALATYPLSFPNAHHAAQVRYNPAIDTIFLPAWCFHYHCNDFMSATSKEEKEIIQHLAFETLIWMGVDEGGLIDDYIRINEFKNLRELLLVQRLPDYTGCGCCHEFDGPEEGEAGFREVVEEDDEDLEVDVEDNEDLEGLIREEAAKIAEFRGTTVLVLQTPRGNETQAEDDGETQEEEKRLTMSEECMHVFVALNARDPGWRIPSVREVDLTRDGTPK